MELGRQPLDHHHGLLQQQQVRLGLHVEIAGDGEQPVEHLADRKLAHRLAAHRLAHRAQGRGEFVDRVMRGHILRLEMDFGDAAVVAGGQAIEDFGQPLPRAAVDPAHDAEVDRGDGPVRLDEQVALVHVGMEESGADRLAEEGEHQPLGERGQIVPGCDQRLAVG